MDTKQSRKDSPVVSDSAKDFWSAVVYDNQTRSLLRTDQQFPSVSSHTKGLKVDPYGSVDIYFGPKAPAGYEQQGADDSRQRLFYPLPPLWSAGAVVRQNLEAPRHRERAINTSMAILTGLLN